MTAKTPGLAARTMYRMSVADGADDQTAWKNAAKAAIDWQKADHAELEDAYAAAHGRVAELEAERDGLRGTLHAIKLGISEPSPKWVAEQALNGRYFDPMNDSGVWGFAAAHAAPEVRARADAADRLIRDTLEALCRRDGLSLESAAAPGEPARNYELADRLGVGSVFGLRARPAAPAEQAAPDPDGQQRYIDQLHDLIRDMLETFPDTADEQDWRDRAGHLYVHDHDGQPYHAYTEDDL